MHLQLLTLLFWHSLNTAKTLYTGATAKHHGHGESCPCIQSTEQKITARGKGTKNILASYCNIQSCQSFSTNSCLELLNRVDQYKVFKLYDKGFCARKLLLFFFLIKFYTKNYDLANKLSTCQQFNINRVKMCLQNIAFAKFYKVLELSVKELDMETFPL